MMDRHIAMFFLAALLIGSCVAAVRAQSGEHGDGHAQMHDIYKGWTPPGNPQTSCCNAQTAEGHGDCRPTRSYFGDDGLWRAWDR
jgi:hypothetical protein